MGEENKKSKLILIGFWLGVIWCFGFGYYNTVLGLRTFRAFGNELGSWFLALVPLLMVAGGYIASVQGRRKMFALYIVGEVLFFVFNLTYLYPQYLGRTLVHEETKLLKDSLGVYQGKLDKVAGAADPVSYSKLKKLREIQTNLLTEIKDRNGFGPYATKQLDDFNKLSGSKYTAEREVGQTQSERDTLYSRWKKNTDKAIKEFIVQLNIDDKNAEKLVNAKYEMDNISDSYIKTLEYILEDNSDVDISHKAVANNVQILLLKELTAKLDKVATDVNSVKEPELFTIINNGKETIQFPKTQKLGSFEHSLISVFVRLNKLDTWYVLIVCFFFDLLGPFLFYFYLRKEEDEFSSYDDDAFGRPWWKRLFSND